MNNNLRAILKEKGVTQKALAEALDVSQNHIVSIIKGEIDMKVSVIKSIAYFLDVPVSTLGFLPISNVEDNGSGVRKSDICESIGETVVGGDKIFAFVVKSNPEK